MSELLKNILDFVNEYYHVFILIIVIGLFVLSVIKPSKKSDFDRVFYYVNKAEELFPESGNGAVKLAYVIKQCADLDPNHVAELVDKVLSSPEKK